MEQFTKALNYQQRAIIIQEEVFDEHDTELATAYSNIARTYVALHRDFDALNYFLRAIAIFEEVHDPLNLDLAVGYSEIAIAYYDMEQYSEAVDYYRRALPILQTVLDSNNSVLIMSYNNIGVAYAKNRQFDEAHNAFSKFEVLGVDKGRAFRNWSIYYALQGKTEQAITFIQKAIDSGFDDLSWLRTDSSMDTLRDDEAFKLILQKLTES